MGDRRTRRLALTLAMAVLVFGGGVAHASVPALSASRFHIYQLEPENPFVGGFDSPAGIAVGPKGDVVYVVDSVQERVVEMTTYGTYVRSWGCCGSGPGKLRTPIGIATDAAGNVYVADQGNGRIEKYSPTGGPLASFSIGSVFGVAVARSGEIYALTRFLNVVVRLGPNGQHLGTFTACPAGQTPAGGIRQTCGVRAIATDKSGDPLILMNRQLHWPEVCNPGSYYNTDAPPVQGWNTVQRFDANGNSLDSWGLPQGPQDCYHGFDPYDDATGLAVDANSGWEYASEIYGDQVDFVDPGFDRLSIGTLGRPPYPARTSIVTGYFTALAFDCESNLFVTSQYGEAVIRYDNPLAASTGCGPTRKRLIAPALIGAITVKGHALLVQVGCRAACRGLLTISSHGRVLARAHVHLGAATTSEVLVRPHVRLPIGTRLLTTFHVPGVPTSQLRARTLAASTISLAVPARARANAAFMVTGVVTPKRRGRIVTMTAAGPGGELVSARTKTRADGGYSLRLTLPRGGGWQVIAAVEPGGGAQPAQSRAFPLAVQPLPLALRPNGPPATVQLSCPAALTTGQTLTVQGRTLPLTAIDVTITPPGGAQATSLVGADQSGAFAVAVVAGSAGTWQVHASVMFGSSSGDCSVPVRVLATPTVTTGPATGVTQTSVTVTGTVNPNGLSTAWHFEYGLTSSYGTQTADQLGVSAIVNVASQLTGLDAGVTYHYRLVASNALGTAYGADQVFATQAPTSTQQANADRAIAVYAALQRYFYAGSVYQGDASSLFTEDYPQSGRTYSYLWPFSRALVGTITLAGIPASLDGNANFQTDVNDRLTGLARYWDGAANPAGYDSYPPAPFGGGGDKYYDDQAWIGLALAQNYRLATTASSLSAAQDVFNFVYPTGLDPTPGTLPDPGGIFWVQQGVGMGLTNHDRTTTSNAPNAELGFRLDQLDPAHAQNYNDGAMTMYGWVNRYLYNVPTSPTYPKAPNPNYDPSQPAIVFDKVRPGGIDETHWTYNQGAMIAANVAAYRQTGLPDYLTNAEAIARAALDTFSESDYINTQPAAFNAIYFRGLLVLYAATSDSTLRATILSAAQAYADDAWNNYRNGQNLFRFPSSSATNYQLLDQGALLQLYAALAWNPSDYDKLP